MSVSILWNTEELEHLFDGYTYSFNETDNYSVSKGIVAVDPGDPSGVVVVNSLRLRLALHETPASGLVSLLCSPGCRWPSAVICETPLHGAVRVFDPWPWKVRGYLELTYGVLGIPVSALKLGKKLVTIKGVSSPHAKDALRYLAVAVSTDESLRKALS